MVENHGRGTDILQELHALLNKIMPLSTRLRSTAESIRTLKEHFESLRARKMYTERHSTQILNEFRGYEIKAEGHLASVALLERRIQETVGLVSILP